MTDTPDRRGATPDRRRGTLEALEEHVDAHVERIEARLSKWLRRGLIAFSIIAIACAISLLGFRSVTEQIQTQREDYIRFSCEAQNIRHVNAINKFNKAAELAIDAAPESEVRIRRTIEANREIIAALSPRQDCAKLAKVALGKAQPPPPDIAPVKTQPKGNR
jgi:hypothetical protein